MARPQLHPPPRAIAAPPTAAARPRKPGARRASVPRSRRREAMLRRVGSPGTARSIAASSGAAADERLRDVDAATNLDQLGGRLIVCSARRSRPPRRITDGSPPTHRVERWLAPMTSHDTSVGRRSLRVRVRGSIARRGWPGRRSTRRSSSDGASGGTRSTSPRPPSTSGMASTHAGSPSRTLRRLPAIRCSRMRNTTVARSRRGSGDTYELYGSTTRTTPSSILGPGRARRFCWLRSSPSRVIGVELWEPWNEIARRNLASAKRFKRAAGIELVQGDAGTYEFPPEPLVVYVPNAFDAVLMNIVATALEQSLSRTPRDLYVIYHNPLQRHVTDTVAAWRPIAEFGTAVIYRATPEAATRAS